eukprot:6491885-Amphidinium_carterae.1
MKHALGLGVVEMVEVAGLLSGVVEMVEVAGLLSGWGVGCLRVAFWSMDCVVDRLPNIKWCFSRSCPRFGSAMVIAVLDFNSCSANCFRILALSS